MAAIFFCFFVIYFLRYVPLEHIILEPSCCANTVGGAGPLVLLRLITDRQLEDS